MANYVYLPREELSAAKKAAIARKRWKENKVTELANGYTWRTDGRTGCLYIKRHDRVLEVFYENSGTPEFDIILYWSSAAWILPNQEALSSAERTELYEELSQWLKETGTKACMS
jgi:hypothetical protein